MAITNHIAILLDRSGSMQRVAGGVIKQYNQQTEYLTKKAEETGQKTHFSLYTFADDADQPILVEVPLDLVNLKPLTSKTYFPNGLTAMLDSIKLASKQLGQFDRGTDDSFLLIVITDGDENRSTDWFAVNDLIRRNSANETWTYVFLVPDGKKRALLSHLPAVYEGNVREWSQTERGVEEYAKATTAGLDSYFTARSQGKKGTRGFFTDLSNVSRGTVAASLSPVNGSFRKGAVANTCQIRPFCEATFGEYRIGHGYYELVKREKVQAQKKMLVEDRSSGVIYGGPDARKVLGFPEGVECTVSPGDHGNWRVYVQSTSVNRNLVPNSSVLYFKP